MKNLHNIIKTPKYTDVELAAIWWHQTFKALNLKFTYVNGKLHDNGNHSDRIVEDTWSKEIVLHQWDDAGRPMPDTSVVTVL